MAVRSFPPGSCGGRRPPPTRSRAASTSTAGARRSGHVRGPGGTRDGDDGAVAADHRNRWRDDVALMAGARHARLPVLGRVAPGAARRAGPASQPGLDWYRARRRPACPRHRAGGHALPLGPPPGPRGRRRVARPRHRPPLRRVRRAGRPAPSATGCGGGARSTSRGARRCSATPPASTPRAAPSRRRGGGRPPPAPGPRAGGRRPAGQAARRPRGRHHAQPVPGGGRGRHARRTTTPPAASTASPTASGTTPSSAAATPTTCWMTWRRSATWPTSATATWRRSPGPSTCSGSTTTAATTCATSPGPRPCRRGRGRPTST